MKALPKLLFTALLLALAAALLSACNINFDGGKNEPPDGTPTEDEIIECDGYTLTVSGTVLRKVKYTVNGAAVKVTVPEGITEIAYDAGRMLMSAVSITIPSTLEVFRYSTPIDYFGLDIHYPKVVEIYDLSPHFDFDLENASYSSCLKQNLKVIHKSAKEPSVLTEKDGFMYCTSADETILVGITEPSEHVTVPAYYEGKPITLAPYAFAEAQSIEHITLSEGITAISKYCLYRTSITQIDLPTTLKSIEKYALICKISSITLPDGIKRIEKGVFEGCSQLTELNLPETVEYFDCSAIEDTAVTSLYIPRSVTQLILELEYNSLEKISKFTVHPENKYYSSEDGVLFNKDGSRLIWYPSQKADTVYTVPSRVRVIGEKAFYSADTLTAVVISEGVERIEAKAFSSCNRLQSITIPKTVSDIGEQAFYYSYHISFVSVHPDNPSYTEIEGVLFDKEVTELIFYPPSKAATTYTVPVTVTAVRDYAAYGSLNLKKLILPNGLRTIGEHAFDIWNDIILTVNFPDTLEYIGKGAFYDCDLVLTWNYTGDWKATDNNGNTVILDKTHFDDLPNLKFKYLKDNYKYTLEKINSTSEN